MNDNIKAIALLGLLGVGLFAGYQMVKKNISIADAGAAAANAIGNAASGVVLGIGDQLGIKRTDETACAKAKAEGRTLDASFDCPAFDFAEYLFTPAPARVSPGYHDPVYGDRLDLSVGLGGVMYDAMGNVIG